MTKADLRRASTSDADAVAQLHLSARREAMPYLPELHSDQEVQAWMRGTLLVETEVWLAKVERQPVGYLALAGDLVDHLYVGPEWQGMGIGSRLLDHAKSLRPTGLRLYTFQRNRRARAFYEERGFVPIAFSDGAGNEENEPDVLYGWRPPTNASR